MHIYIEIRSNQYEWVLLTSAPCIKRCNPGIHGLYSTIHLCTWYAHTRKINLHVLMKLDPYIYKLTHTNLEQTQSANQEYQTQPESLIVGRSQLSSCDSPPRRRNKKSRTPHHPKAKHSSRAMTCLRCENATPPVTLSPLPSSTKSSSMVQPSHQCPFQFTSPLKCILKCYISRLDQPSHDGTWVNLDATKTQRVKFKKRRCYLWDACSPYTDSHQFNKIVSIENKVRVLE